MPGRPALRGDAAMPRIAVLLGNEPLEVFEVIAQDGDVLEIRAAFLFEVGEELEVRVERDGRTVHTTARVRAHRDASGDPPARTTELELTVPRIARPPRGAEP